MSFDIIRLSLLGQLIGLNPFRAGRCLSTLSKKSLWKIAKGLNPFRAGQCLSTKARAIRLESFKGLNPFRAGQCLSTEEENG